MQLEDLLQLIGTEAERATFQRRGQRYYQAHQQREACTSAAAPDAEARREELLDQIMHRLRYYFRAIRHPLPTRQEVAEMIMAYFKT